MRKAGFWKTDWFLGLIVSAVMLVLAGSDLVQSLERKAYDWGVRALPVSRCRASPSLRSTTPPSPILAAGRGHATCTQR